MACYEADRQSLSRGKQSDSLPNVADVCLGSVDL